MINILDSVTTIKNVGDTKKGGYQLTIEVVANDVLCIYVYVI